MTTTTTLNSGTPATVTYAYNELGQLQTKKLGSASTIANQYNIQGWLTSQTSSKFSLGLDYFSSGRRDGNITKLSWGQGSVTDQYYTLNYDKFGRMTTGVHSLSKFNETIGSYDLNGNIKSLTRTANGSTSDNFTYTYSGNLTNDPRKSLNFVWSALNTPTEIKSGSTVKAKYLYSYDGTKVKVQDAGNVSGYDYLGGLTLIKTNNTLTPEYHFGEGIIKGNEVMYFEKDHLGSTRAVLNTSGSVLEKNDYYPFGLRHTNSSYALTASNRYKFNGKEDQTIGSLNLLDYGARMYDGQIGRWFSIDQLAEKYYSTGPYVYCINNPINAIDPDGKKVIFVNGYLGFGSPIGGEAYWSKSFISGAKTFFNDNANPYFTNIEHGALSGASGRFSNGYKYAEENYTSLTDGMKEDEKFRLVSHSMGGAFATGMQKYLEEQGWTFDYSVYINTYQSGSIKTRRTDQTLIIDYQNTNDPVLFWLDPNLGLGKIKNADAIIREKSDKETGYIHKGPISDGEDFWEKLQKTLDELFNKF